ncbi:MAG TPA: hypothetical protein VMT38_00520 [Terracidiphilus sp.]|nr:hypothetical protein [Terracidiphilus sp.]
MSRKSIAIWIAICAGVAAVLIGLGIRHWRPRWSVIQGAVIRRDTDSRKQAPIAGVTVNATAGNEHLSAESDASGYFRIAFPGTVLPGQTVILDFQHSDFKPLELRDTIRFRSSLRQLLIVQMEPRAAQTNTGPARPATAVTNIRVRYTVNSQNEENIGSAARTFQVENQGNVPCRHDNLCSPDGYWKAARGSIQLDAGVGNIFRDARASCIAGPCPFTRIDTSGFVNPGRTLTVSALDWSGTATFLVEAEVFHTAVVSNVRRSFPVVFGRSLSFTLPGSAEGVSLEAELNGVDMVFPLGPELYLSWASCAERSSQAKSTVYQCELKPDYHF